MKFRYFKFENFKGIEKQTLDLSKNPDSKVYTLVGLNESGKTTVLEAINYFAYKPESLDALNLDNTKIEDIHNLIPINKRDNFNGSIIIEAGLELNQEDIDEITKTLKKEAEIILTNCPKNLSFTQKYHFKNSTHLVEKDENLWKVDWTGRVGKGRKDRSLKNEECLLAFPLIKKRIPSILYFPNFLFEFPERIYLDPTFDDPIHNFYRIIIQDVLDSLDNETNVAEHLIERILSDKEKEKRNLNSLLGKMQRKLSDVIFNKWNQIFNKVISRAEIVLLTGKDETNGAYIEFNIKDDVDTYRIIERSLGFRWFFVYILLTQFRVYRKLNNNAFFLFDEPASNLHPSAQSQLLESFEHLPKVMYTTHSHYLINPRWLENTFVIKNQAIDYEKEEEYNSRNTDVRIFKYRDFAVKFPNQSSYFQPILEILDYRPSNLALVPKVIITEGKNDFYTYSYLQEILFKKINLNFLPGTSSGNLETLISLYLGWGVKFLVLLDSDAEGLKQKTRYEGLYGNSILERVITYRDIEDTWKNFETESLFNAKDHLIIQSSCYESQVKFNKKIFNRSLQELFSKKQNVTISLETKTNFQKIFKYLNQLL